MFYRQLFLSTFVIFLCFSSIVCAASHLYVDFSNGDDGWDGSSPAYQSGSVGPKKTLTAARDTVRQWISSGLSGDVYVELRGGRYELASTLTFNNQDYNSLYYIIWRNYNGEDVRISGGKQITGSWSWDAAKGCYKTYIPEVASGSWWFRDLYRNDRRLIRARWPNAPTDTMKQAWATSVRMPSDANLLTITSVNTEKTQISFNTALPQPLGVSDKAEAVVFYLWTTMRTVIDHNSGSTVYLADAMDGCLAIQPGNEYARKGFLENSYTFIDKNDEWALDTAGYLYYLGQDPNGQVFMAPRIDNLILVQGSSVGDRVRNLHFVGLTFEHGNFKFPNGGLDWNPRQAGVPCNYVHIPAAVRFAYTANCSLQDCNVVRSSGVGVHLDTGSWGDRVERCTVADIGNSGIILGNAAEETVSPTRTAYGRVENNIIYKCGLGDFSSLGVGEIFMHGASICHNEIYDLPNTGISLGWHWWGSTVNVNAQNITVEYNYVHNVCQFMDDGGAIYTLDDLTNSSISHNLIQRIGWDGQTCSGFYADEGSSRFKFFGNVIDTIYRGWCCFLHFETNDAQVRNNIFIDGQWREFYVSHKQGFTGYFMNFSNNIVCQKTNADSWLTFTKGFDNPSQYDVDLNCYYNPSNPTKVFAGYSWDHWRNTLGNDSNSYYQQDPMFEDGSHADKNYLLRPESPLLALPMNFQQVKVKDAGVQPLNADVENRAYNDIAARLAEGRPGSYSFETLQKIADAWLSNTLP